MDICYECQEPMVKKHGNITLTKTGYGSYEVIGVLHLACNTCGAKVILPDETERVEAEGIRLHILKVLKEKGPILALDLKEEVRSTVELLESVALQLVKENIISIDYTKPEAPVIALKKGSPELTFWDKIRNKFK